MQVLQLFFCKNLYCLFLFWVLQFYFNKTKYIVQIMKMQAAKKMKEAWGIRIWPH